LTVDLKLKTTIMVQTTAETAERYNRNLNTRSCLWPFPLSRQAFCTLFLLYLVFCSFFTYQPSHANRQTNIDHNVSRQDKNPSWRSITRAELTSQPAFFSTKTFQQTPHETVLQYCARKKPRGERGRPLLPVFNPEATKNPERISHPRFKTQQETRKIAHVEQ
jgi:hypothetical protein